MDLGIKLRHAASRAAASRKAEKPVPTFGDIAQMVIGEAQRKSTNAKVRYQWEPIGHFETGKRPPPVLSVSAIKLIDEKLIADGMTAAQTHMLVGDILERLALPNKRESDIQPSTRANGAPRARG